MSDKNTDSAGRALPEGFEALGPADYANNPAAAHIVASAGVASRSMAHIAECLATRMGVPLEVLPHTMASALGDMIGTLSVADVLGEQMLSGETNTSIERLAELCGEAVRANILNGNARAKAIDAALKDHANAPLAELLRRRAEGNA